MQLDKLHLTTYTRFVNAFMKAYGLTGWHVEVVMEPSDDAMAWVSPQPAARRADFGLAATWSEEPTEERLRDKAQHEVIHVLLARLSEAANSRFATEAELTTAEEEVVIRLMDLLPKKRGKRSAA